MEIKDKRVICLGCLYSGNKCAICMDRANWGLSSYEGPVGCVDAIKHGLVYCDKCIEKLDAIFAYPPEIIKNMIIKNILIVIGLLTILLTGCANRGHVATTVVYDTPPVIIWGPRPIMIDMMYGHHSCPIYRSPVYRLPIHRMSPTINPPKPNIAPRIERHR